MKRISLFTAILLFIISNLQIKLEGACTIELLPHDYENEKCLSYKEITVLVKENGAPVEGARVEFLLDDIDDTGYGLTYSSPIFTDPNGQARNKVLFGNYGTAIITCFAEYNSQNCGSVAVDLSVGIETLSGTVRDSGTGDLIEAAVTFTHFYSGETLRPDSVNAGSYIVDLPVCDYLVAATAAEDPNYHQVLLIRAEMTKDAATVQDIPVTRELCNGLDDDGDGQIDEDFADPASNYFGPLGSSCKAASGVCAGTYLCSGNGLYTVCSSLGTPCEFCENFLRDPDNDYDVYRGLCGHDGRCMKKMDEFVYASFRVFSQDKEDCSSGCTPQTTDLDAVESARCN